MSTKDKTNTSATSLRLLSEDKEHNTGVTKNTTFRVDPNEVIFEKGFNVRADDETLKEHIERLYQAMKAGAQMPPVDLRVDCGKMYVVDGHSRTTAARRMKKENPDFSLEARQFRGNDQDRVLHMLGTGSGQKPLTPLEQGLGYLRLIKFGLSNTEIAQKLGISSQTVVNGLILAEAPAEVQELVKTGQVSSTTAREAVKGGAEGVKALVETAKEVAAAPAPTPAKNGKPAKKKKVTAKKLKGTAAAKKPAKKAEVPVTAEGEIVLKVQKEDAQATVDFLKANAPDDNKHTNAIIGALELAMM